MKPRFRSAWMAAMAASGLAVAGCDRPPRACVPVSGRVTLRGAPLPGPGHITFAPVSGGPATGGGRPCQVKIRADGRYEAAYDRRCRGLFPGTYRVGVSCWKVPDGDGPDQLEQPAGIVSLVPDRYRTAATSGLVVEVPADAPRVEFSVDLE